jgi:HTH-type transcriptional regulator, competence development regulator
VPESALGQLLKNLRSDRGLTLRETGQLAEVDHAYVHRLETGTKESPSEEVLARLAKALKAPKREAEMLRYLAAHSQADPGLVDFVRTDPTISFEVFAAAASAAFRGRARPDYAGHVGRIRRILEEDDDG